METKQNKQKTNIPLHPLAGSSFTNWIKLFLAYGGIDKKYFLKAFLISIVTFLNTPLRIAETIKFRRKIKYSQVEQPPIFIIGHWRSGTTYLVDLMSQDKNFGYVSNFQTYLPEIFLGSQQIWEPIFKKVSPSKRPIDNVIFSLDKSGEEEYAIGNISAYSFYHCFFFPKKMIQIFKQVVLFDGQEQVKTEWKNLYMSFLKKVNLSVNGKRLILKNPANTARIKILLEIFPDAKFIHIYRNPYTVYASTRHLYKKILPEFMLQDIEEKEIESNIIKIYQDVMQRFFLEKEAIPEQNFVEIKYENFIGNELAELRRIYDKLNLPNFEKVENQFKSYIDSLSDYENNKYSFEEETVAKIYNSWRFTIDKWQYNPPK